RAPGPKDRLDEAAQRALAVAGSERALEPVDRLEHLVAVLPALHPRGKVVAELTISGRRRERPGPLPFAHERLEIGEVLLVQRPEPLAATAVALQPEPLDSEHPVPACIDAERRPRPCPRVAGVAHEPAAGARQP